jgi:aminodeoxyfutalosine synthase
MDAGLKRELEAKVYAGERLSREDGVALFASDDLAWLGRLAHHRRTEMNGYRVMFDVNRKLDLTPAFPDKEDGEDPYARRAGEAVRAAERMAGQHCTELRIVDGLHSGLPWHYCTEVLRGLKAALPGVGLKWFAATDVRRFERISGRPAGAILDELIEAGLDSLTGGGAEIFDREVRQHLVEHDCDWEDWSRIHRLAHSKGMKTPATMLYGHIEEPRHRVDHIVRLRELQDDTGGFAAFIPLRYRPDLDEPADGEVHDRLRARTTPAAPAESLKTFAVSRLMFDNVPHVECSWVTHGRSVAQLSLHFGADELDGPVVDDDIADDDPDTMHRDDLLNLIWDAGFRPVERDAHHEVVRAYDGPPSLAARRSEPQQVWA